MSQHIRHILSLSGGKDSSALALYMRDCVPDMEYIFHDTEKELPETHEYLARLEALLGKPIVKTKPEYSFDAWLKVYGGMIPSAHRRWCTRMLKLKPFEAYVGDAIVYNYIGIRADEHRTGYISHKPNIVPVYPFQEDGLVLADIVRILEESGLGLPTFTEWGRTRSGCFFCFYQQKIEWVRLREKYPDRYKEAKEYEYVSSSGEAFYWNGNESLEELEKPDRIAQIKRDWEQAQARLRKKHRSNALVHILGGLEEDEERNICLVCQL
jgi:hypothetical protein